MVGACRKIKPELEQNTGTRNVNFMIRCYESEGEREKADKIMQEDICLSAYYCMEIKKNKHYIELVLPTFLSKMLWFLYGY